MNTFEPVETNLMKKTLIVLIVLMLPATSFGGGFSKVGTASARTNTNTLSAYQGDHAVN